MKMSKRNIERLALEQERLARGKPIISKFERKNLTPDEIRQRELAIVKQSKGVVKTNA